MRLSLALFATAVALVFTGCTATQGARAKSTLNEARVDTETVLAKALVSEPQEEQLGLQVEGELAKEGVKYSSDREVINYVTGLVQRIAPFAQKDRQTNFQVHVIDDPRTVNAFATPGGHVHVYTGLLLAADNEAEVVGVLSHEVGHIVARHAARQLVETYGIQAVLGLALGKEPNTLEKIAAGILGNGALLAHSRADENEADAYAVKYASAAGYDPSGISKFFQKLVATQGNSPRLLTWLTTHPATSDRIAHVNQLITDQNLTGSEVGADRLAAIKQRLGSPNASPAAPTPAPTPAQPAPTTAPVRKQPVSGP